MATLAINAPRLRFCIKYPIITVPSLLDRNSISASKLMVDETGSFREVQEAATTEGARLERDVRTSAIRLKQHRVEILYGDQRVEFRGKHVDLFALLICLEAWASADDVQSLPAWRTMKRESVGKEVSALIKRLQRQGLEVIAFQNRTRGWRLAPEVEVCEETRAAARTYLESRGWMAGARFSAVAPEALARWAIAASAANLAMTEGRAEDGLTDLRRAYAATDHGDLKAIADVLATRIGQRLSRPHLPVPGEGRSASVFEIAVDARRRAAYAIRSDSRAWERQLVELKALLPALSGNGNLTTQACVQNALALLHRRLGRHEEALRHACEATPLAIFSGDFTLIQSALFNFGNILSEVRRTDPDAVPEGLAADLIEADRAIRHRFGLGKDSAQAELLLAFLAWEEGALDRAEAYLEEARAIIAISRIPADEALEARITGLVLLARGDRAGLSVLGQAIARFEAIGNKASADYVRGERARLAQQFT
jgi:tetratricopeptide (TPR) repeat protein